jgi:hypothetical protein
MAVRGGGSLRLGSTWAALIAYGAGALRGSLGKGMVRALAFVFGGIVFCTSLRSYLCADCALFEKRRHGGVLSLEVGQQLAQRFFRKAQ